MKTILITGINGFLGSKLASKLIHNYVIIGIDKSRANPSRLKNIEVEVFNGEDDFECIFIKNRIDAIIHTATIYESGGLLSKQIETNILLPIRLIEIGNKYGCKLFLNTDSFFNDGRLSYKYLESYSFSKKNLIDWFAFLNAELKIVNMKLFHMYGPDDNPNKFIPILLKRLLNNEPNIDMTMGEQRRDFIYIDDVVSAFELVLSQEYNLWGKFNEIEVGSAVSTSIRELALLMKNIAKSTSKLNFGGLPYREGELMFSSANNIKLKQLGWLIEYDLERGLIKTIIENT